MWSNYIIECDLIKPIKKAIIKKLEKWTKFKPIIDKEHIVKISSNQKSSYVTIVALWTLWNSRNKLFFENKQPNIVVSIKFLEAILKRLVNFHFQKFNQEKFRIIWTKNNPYIKITNNKLTFDFI